MSSVPPPGSGTPPPPPPPPSQGPPPPYTPTGAGLAWETQAIGPESFLDTAKLFITAPTDAWARTRETGDYMRPLLFAIVIAWIGAIFNAVWSTMFGAGMLRMLPPEYASRLGAFGMGRGGLLVNIILAPIFILCGLFIGAAIFHVSLDRRCADVVPVAVRGDVPRRVVLVDRAPRLRDPGRRRPRGPRLADLSHGPRGSAAPQGEPAEGDPRDPPAGPRVLRLRGDRDDLRGRGAR